MSARMRRGLIAAGVVAAVLILAAASLYGWARAELTGTVAGLKASAPDGVAVAVGEERLDVPGRAAILTDIAVTDQRREKPRRLAVDRLVIGPDGLRPPGPETVPRVRAEGLRMRRGERQVMAAETAVMENVDLAAWQAAGDGPNAAAGLFGQPLFTAFRADKLRGEAAWGAWEMARLRLDEAAIQAGRMRALTWTLSDVVLQAEEGGLLPPGEVRELAPEALRGDLTFRAGVTGPEGREGVEISDFRLAAQGQGTLAGDLALKGLDVRQALADPEAPPAERAQDVQLDSLTLHYGDDGLAGRVLAQLAEARGQAREAYVADLVSLMEARWGETDATASLARFLRQRDRVTVRLRPDEPVGVMGMALGFMIDPQMMLGRLNVAVSNEGLADNGDQQEN